MGPAMIANRKVSFLLLLATLMAFKGVLVLVRKQEDVMEHSHASNLQRLVDTVLTVTSTENGYPEASMEQFYNSVYKQMAISSNN